MGVFWWWRGSNRSRGSVGGSWGWALLPSADLDFINVTIFDHIRTLIIFFATSAQASSESDKPQTQATFGSRLKWVNPDFGLL